MIGLWGLGTREGFKARSLSLAAAGEQVSSRAVGVRERLGERQRAE